MKPKKIGRRDKKTLKKYFKWMDYEIGFSGYGTSLVDIKPPVRLMPKERQRVERKYGDALNETRGQITTMKQDAWREAIMHTLGEDPDDWGMY